MKKLPISPRPHTARGTLPPSRPAFLTLSYWSTASAAHSPAKGHGVPERKSCKRRRS